MSERYKAVYMVHRNERLNVDACAMHGAHERHYIEAYLRAGYKLVNRAEFERAAAEMHARFMRGERP